MKYNTLLRATQALQKSAYYPQIKKKDWFQKSQHYCKHTCSWYYINCFHQHSLLLRYHKASFADKGGKMRKQAGNAQHFESHAPRGRPPKVTTQCPAMQYAILIAILQRMAPRESISPSVSCGTARNRSCEHKTRQLTEEEQFTCFIRNSSFLKNGLLNHP